MNYHNTYNQRLKIKVNKLRKTLGWTGSDQLSFKEIGRPTIEPIAQMGPYSAMVIEDCPTLCEITHRAREIVPYTFSRTI